ncbi:hypothetical protein CcaCcLH18_01192 [Colletotrichum camelliae]|nr:hypothetical protein CcaCcLH18_01192 [Colletotrichum camelliae]
MAAHTSSKIHVAINGPSGATFPSFASTDLAGGNLQKIFLSNIRNKCNISAKLHFTADGTTRLDDQLSLEYYMSLTVEGTNILKAITPAISAPDVAADSSAAKDGQAAAPVVVSTANVTTFVVKILDGTSASEALRPIPETNAAMAKLLEQVRQVKGVEPGVLPVFTNTELAALSANYGPKPSASHYKEPAELTESEWSTVLKNTRALSGYYVDDIRGIFMKAPKAAFRVRGTTKPGVPLDGDELQPMQYYPLIPPYHISDNASVNVTEIQEQSQKTLVKQGFNLVSMSGSLGGGMKIPMTVSVAVDTEHSSTKQERKSTYVDSLTVTYNFPRVGIEFDTTTLELTPECALDARKVSNRDQVQHFYRTYGNVFVTSLTLGGFLLSTRNVTKDEQTTLDQVKDQTRKAAGISFQTPSISGSLGIANSKGSSSSDGSATLNQKATLAWDAHGGNTLLAANPTEWVNTVKDYRLWRLMDQQRVVQLIGLIQDLDRVAYQNLLSPEGQTNTGKDPITDNEYNKRIRRLINEACRSEDPGSSALLKNMEDKWRDKSYNASPALDEYLQFINAHYPDANAAIIPPGFKFGGLSKDQKIYFGLFLASKGDMTFN